MLLFWMLLAFETLSGALSRSATTTVSSVNTQRVTTREDVETTTYEDNVMMPKHAVNISQLVKLQPTRYHYFPHNQHVFLLPECAAQQVCGAVYSRRNESRPLCACPSRLGPPCSASLAADDLHTTPLHTDTSPSTLTLLKTCERSAEVRACRAPSDWSLLALQNVRTGKAHYLLLCRCEVPLQGPRRHAQPAYASVPGIRVFGMLCAPKETNRLPPAAPTPASWRALRTLHALAKVTTA